jgi:hypothetical protein
MNFCCATAGALNATMPNAAALRNAAASGMRVELLMATTSWCEPAKR